jgi:hypothetical protein
VNVRRSANRPVSYFPVSWIQDRPGITAFIYEKHAIFRGNGKNFPCPTSQKLVHSGKSQRKGKLISGIKITYAKIVYIL